MFASVLKIRIQTHTQTPQTTNRNDKVQTIPVRKPLPRRGDVFTAALEVTGGHWGSPGVTGGHRRSNNNSSNVAEPSSVAYIILSTRALKALHAGPALITGTRGKKTSHKALIEGRCSIRKRRVSIC